MHGFAFPGLRVAHRVGLSVQEFHLPTEQDNSVSTDIDSKGSCEWRCFLEFMEDGGWSMPETENVCGCWLYKSYDGQATVSLTATIQKSGLL